MLSEIAINLLIIIAAGFIAGLICRALGLSMLIGYLVVGIFLGIGESWLVTKNLLEDKPERIESIIHLAELGVFLLLFTIGLEFSLEKIGRMSRHLLVGGGVQMLLAGGAAASVAMLFGLKWEVAFVVGAAVSLSSTVLVFKALTEWGHSQTPPGLRAISILLFQDIALVPLLLLIPLLGTGGTEGGTPWQQYGTMVIHSCWLIGLVFVTRQVVVRWGIPILARFRNIELVVLFTLVVLGGITFAAKTFALPPALGALAAGLIFSETRLARQVEAVILPFREAFAAIFFVSLGLLFNPQTILDAPLFLGGALVGVILLKWGASAVALRLTGLNWKMSAGMGLGLAHLGEFSFAIILLAKTNGLLDGNYYQNTLCIAIGTLILTPLLMKIGLRWVDMAEFEKEEDEKTVKGIEYDIEAAVVIGAGPVGRRVASQLETFGKNVSMVDLSPVNLHPFAQQNFRTVAGDATDPDVLRHAHIEHSQMVIICVPDDQVAELIVRSARRLAPKSFILVRCRYQNLIPSMKKAGADSVVSEESEAALALTRILLGMNAE